MTEPTESPNITEFKRAALLDGNRAGKMPVPAKKLGKWVWPTSAAALALATIWGSTHIEAQVEAAAPSILESASVGSAGLLFDATYRTVDVSGELPANVSSDKIETILASFDGSNGENIRNAYVSATPAAIINPKPDTNTNSNLEGLTEDVRVSAVVDLDQIITLNGVVPSQDNADLLEDAAEQSFSSGIVVNNLHVSDLPARTENAEQRINDLATVLSNLDSDILDAQIDLDADLLTGNITTSNTVTTNKIKALLPQSYISVLTDADTEAQMAEIVQQETYMPEIVPSPELFSEPEIYIEPLLSTGNNASYLQSNLDLLAGQISEYVVFAPASDVLQTSATEVLDEIVTALNDYQGTSIEIGGHTDSQSSASYNLSLSQRRAQAVADYIAERGIDRTRLAPIGLGESQPIASNNTAVGRAQNRRVEFIAY